MINQTMCRQHLSSSINYLCLVKEQSQCFSHNLVAEGDFMEGVDIVIKGERRQLCKIIIKFKNHDWDPLRNAHAVGVEA